MKKFIVAMAVSALCLGVYGCKKADTTAEDVEKKAGEAVENVEKKADTTVEKVEKAGEAAKDVVKGIKK